MTERERKQLEQAARLADDRQIIRVRRVVHIEKVDGDDYLIGAEDADGKRMVLRLSEKTLHRLFDYLERPPAPRAPG